MRATRRPSTIVGKANAGKPDKRPLGIPVICDRVVQMACKLVIEPIFEQTEIVDCDILGFFENVDHNILLKLVRRRISDPRVLMLISGWLQVARDYMRGPASINELREMLEGLGISLPITENTSILGETVDVGNRISPNRFVALPMEGADCDMDGSPTGLTFRRYERMAAGGAGIIWLEACAVAHGGRSKANAFFLQKSNLAMYKELVDRMRNAASQDIICILQLTHSGRYSKPGGEPKPVMVRHCPELDEAENLPDDYPLATDRFLDELVNSYVEAAVLAQQAGFDGVDVKACHGYLVSSLLGAHERKGKYGGSYEHRTRFLKDVITAIHKQCPSLLVTVRLNIFDGMRYPYGFGVSNTNPEVPDLEEPIRLVKQLGAMNVALLGVSMGYPRFDPHFGRPSATGQTEHPLVGIKRFCDLTGQVQAAIPGIPVVNAALAWVEAAFPQVAAGLVESRATQLIGQGRNGIAYPDSVRDILETNTFSRNACCVACSGCSRLLRDGKHVGCIVRDKSVYNA